MSNAHSSDEDFVRAAFANVIGRDPTLEELGYGLKRLDENARDYLAELFATGEAELRRANLDRLAARPGDEAVVLGLFASVLGREPTATELAYGVHRLREDARDYVSELCGNEEAGERRHRIAEHARLFVYPGHYYSPICNVAELEASHFLADLGEREIHAIDLGLDRQGALFERLSRHFHAIAFPNASTGDFRYHVENEFYCIGDALILSAFIQEFRPGRIVEVGSGFSSAVMLDTLDRMGEHGSRTTCTFVEPYPDRLRRLLRDTDHDRVTVLEARVQDVDPGVFTALAENDILFLDTTHVCRTGSDVNFELFRILPRLKSGVIIHFHDIFFNFEYLGDWVLKDNRSWNEIYLLQAFLMYNDQFEIAFFNHHFAKTAAETARQASADFARMPGGGLWLRKI